MVTVEKTLLPPTVAAVLPAGLVREVESVARSRADAGKNLSEIRLRAGGLSALVVGGENVPLVTSVSREEVSRIAERICHGSLYAYRDEIAKGYLPMEGGVRVGLCGQARYEGGKILGVSDFSTLVFRLPRAVSETAEELSDLFRRHAKHGMLIYSPPGGGKTTALRSLAALLGTGRGAMRVAVVDERCEFSPDDYPRASVDLLRGYGRAEGIGIATRTLNAEVVLIDEIGDGEEALAVLSASRAGIPVVATAHGGTFSEVSGRRILRPLFEAGLFDVAVGIEKKEGKFSLTVDVPGAV